MRTWKNAHIVVLIILLAIQGAILIGYGLASLVVDDLPAEVARSAQTSEASAVRMATPIPANQPAPESALPATTARPPTDRMTAASIAVLIVLAVGAALGLLQRTRWLPRLRSPAPQPAHASEAAPQSPPRRQIEWTPFWILAIIMLVASVVAGAILRIGLAGT
jgi:hypothetical protein